MSVIVKGMGMPRDCPACSLSYWANHSTFLGCRAVPGKRYAMQEEQYRESDTPPDWCPLHPLPDVHGDLIDRDALPSRVEWEDIINAPVIVGAEGKEPIMITGKIYFVDGHVYIDMDKEDKV